MTQHPPHTTPPPSKPTVPPAPGRRRVGDPPPTQEVPHAAPPPAREPRPVGPPAEAIHAGLDPEQEIRARAAELAVAWLHPHWTGSPGERGSVLDAAAEFAAWIRDGSRRDAAPQPECTCGPWHGNKRQGDPDCPAHFWGRP